MLSVERGSLGRLPGGGLIPELVLREWIRRGHKETVVGGGIGREPRSRQRKQYLQRQRHDDWEQREDLTHRIWVRDSWGWVTIKARFEEGLTQLLRVVCVLGIGKVGRKMGGKKQKRPVTPITAGRERQQKASEHCLRHKRKAGFTSSTCLETQNTTTPTAQSDEQLGSYSDKSDSSRMLCDWEGTATDFYLVNGKVTLE